MTLSEQNACKEAAMHFLQRTLRYRHYTKLEMDYLSEVMMEIRGESNIKTKPEKAKADLLAILEFLECCSRLAPLERQEVLDYCQIEG